MVSDAKNEEFGSHIYIRKSDRLRDKPKTSYRNMLDNCVMGAQSSMDDAPASFDDVKHRGDRTQWE